MDAERGAGEVRSEARGSHWLAWVGPPAGPGREQPVVMVGTTREEAEERLRVWLAARARTTG
jgi:hypothetical protein